MTTFDRPTASALVFALFCAMPASAQALEGTSWRTASGNGVVRIEPCDAGKICGVITRGTPPAGQPAVDGRNPDPALRTRPLQGIRILSGFTRRPDGKFAGGQIYNPEDGRTYRSEFKQRPDGKLEVKGCVGPICQTQLWTPVR